MSSKKTKKNERWKVVFEDYYVSTEGRLRRGRGMNAKIMRPYINSRGYPCVSLRGTDPRINTTLGNLVLRTFRKRPYEKAPVSYKDGNPANCRLENLEWRG